MANPERAGRAPLFFIGVVFLFIGAIFTGIGGSIFYTEQQYRRDGVRTEAIVTGKHLEPATADTGTDYTVSYRFTQADGSPAEQTESVAVHQWEGLERESRVAIEYVAGQPGTARLLPESAEETIVSLIAMGLGGTLVLIGLSVIVAGLLRRAPAPAAPEAAPAPPWDDEDEEAAERRFPRHPLTTGPRRAQSAWQLMRSAFGFWFGGIFLLVGSPFLLISLFLIYDDWSFANEARSTQGIVLAKTIRTSSSGSGSRRSTSRHYEVTYRFTVEGETYEGKSELSHGHWQGLREREPVEVHYRPQRPASNQVAGRSRWFLKTIFFVLGSIFTAIGGTFFVRAVTGARREAYLRQQGVTTHGTIVALEPRNLKVNGVQQWHLRFEYRDFQGQRHEETITIPVHDAETWKVGESGRVLYDSNRPARAVWLGRES